MKQTKGILALALGVFLALAAGAPAPVQAYCPSECKRYDPKQGYCIEYGPVGAGCNTPGSSAPAASYGAIAFGATSGSWGTSYHWGSKAKAESVAMQTCAKYGKDCEVVVWFDRKCGAVVWAEDASTYWGLGDSEAQARDAAEKNCATGGGKNCKVQAYQCSK